MYRANSEGQADTDKMEDPRQSNVAHKRNIGESGSDNEEKTQIGPNEVDDVHMRRVEALSHQKGGEMELAVGPLQDGDGKVDMMSEVESSGDKGVNLHGTHLGIKQANAKKTKEDDASLNLGEERDSCRVQLVEKKKTDKTKRKVTRTQRLHYGLENQGATCYLNSVLQVLSMTTEMHDRLNPRSKPDLPLRKIFEGLKKATRGTKTITAAFGIQNVREQRDAAECLEMILCKISPQASEVFKGALTHKTKCSKGHEINVETNPFWTLPLSLKDTHDSSYSLEMSFESIFKSKSFSGRNIVYCNDCNKKTEAERGSEMVVFPPILTLHIKRFDFDYNTMTYFKSNCRVDVPRALQRENKKYELYAMVNHHGSLRDEHYTATILSNKDNTWYEFDDTQIYKVKEQPFAENNPFNSRTVYLLMYRASEMTDDAAEQQDGKVTRTQRLHYGLENQGATCYLNSVLQVLSMTTEMHDRLNPRSKPNLQLRKIFEGLKEATCGTKTITAAFGIKNVWEQRDAAECLEMILCKISPRASEVFQGALTHKTKCSKGHKINVETNPFWTLPLSLKDTHDSSYSVEMSFESIFKSKSFSGRNIVYCNDCNKKTEAERGCEMVGFPQILTVLLKRFDFDYNTMTYFKSDCSVDVPRALQRENKKYELYAMVNHYGSLRGGHYTATILSNEDNTWYEFDDTHIYKVKEQPFAENNSFNSRTVYLLMYRASKTRVTDDAAEQQDEKATECQKPDEKRERERREADDEEKTKTRQTEENEENEGPVRTDLKTGEEEDVEQIQNDKSVPETSNAISMTTADSTIEVQSSADEEAQDNLLRNGDSGHSSVSQENTNSTLEELKQPKVEDAPDVSVGEESTDFCGQCLNEETEKPKLTGENCPQLDQRACWITFFCLFFIAIHIYFLREQPS